MRSPGTPLMPSIAAQMTDIGEGVWIGSGAVVGYSPSDYLWAHDCFGRPGSLARIDVTSGRAHMLVSPDPLHIEASILCPDCGKHGFIRGGQWVSA